MTTFQFFCYLMRPALWGRSHIKPTQSLGCHPPLFSWEGLRVTLCYKLPSSNPDPDKCDGLKTFVTMTTFQFFCYLMRPALWGRSHIKPTQSLGCHPPLFSWEGLRVTLCYKLPSSNQDPDTPQIISLKFV